MNSIKCKRIFVCILLIAIISLSSICLQFVKKNVGLILWDYSLTCDAFYSAFVQLERDELSDIEVLKDLGDNAFVFMWQVRDLSESVLINSGLYSDKLEQYLFDCTAADSLSSQDIDRLVSLLPDIYMELNQIDWEHLWTNENLFFYKNDVLESIKNVNYLISGTL